MTDTSQLTPNNLSSRPKLKLKRQKKEFGRKRVWERANDRAPQHAFESVDARAQERACGCVRDCVHERAQERVRECVHERVCLF
jgi:hypothetical protein